MATITRSANAVLLVFTLLTPSMRSARASLFSLAASGTISVNTSGDTAIPVGTPWSFELTYDTAAPDLDPEDTTFGRFTNTTAPPAMTFFHYRAGDYEVTIEDPADFDTLSDILTTFTASIDGIDVNIFAPDFFPHLAGGPVSFHADFAKFTTPRIFMSDALPTNTTLGPESFDDANVSLLPPNSVVTSGNLTSFTLMANLPGDFNGNGAVENADLTLLLNNWASPVPPTPGGWIGTPLTAPAVDNDELTALLNNWGATTGSGTNAAATPEPATLILLTIAAAVWIFRRRAS